MNHPWYRLCIGDWTKRRRIESIDEDVTFRFSIGSGYPDYLSARRNIPGSRRLKISSGLVHIGTLRSDLAFLIRQLSALLAAARILHIGQLPGRTPAMVSSRSLMAKKYGSLCPAEFRQDSVTSSAQTPPRQLFVYYRL